MRYQPISPDFFKNNRRRFAREMKPRTALVLHSNDQMPRSGDTTFPFRQSADLFYLTGIDQEETVLLMMPDCPNEKLREILFIKRTDEHIMLWEGKKLTKEEATKISGIEKVLFLDEASVPMNEVILLAEGIYANTREYEKYFGDTPTRDERKLKELKKQYPAHAIHRAQPIFKRLAMTKSGVELDLLKKAIEITSNGLIRACEFIRPGVFEFEIEAEITHEFAMNRANGHAYSPIIATGANACVLHYITNHDECRDGDVLLMDFGAEYANYAADLTRSVPVSGRFTDRQADVYSSVLKVLKDARAMLVPGTLLEEYQKEVGKMMQSELKRLGLIDQKAIDEGTEDKPAYKKYFPHGTSHHLGIDVHDRSLRYEPFRAGMVFTVEPGIYIPAEKLGIRLENNVLITDHGPIDLFDDIPIEIEAIEEMMNAKVYA